MVNKFFGVYLTSLWVVFENIFGPWVKSGDVLFSQGLHLIYLLIYYLILYIIYFNIYIKCIYIIDQEIYIINNTYFQ